MKKGNLESRSVSDHCVVAHDVLVSCLVGINNFLTKSVVSSSLLVHSSTLEHCHIIEAMCNVNAVKMYNVKLYQYI